MRYCLSPNTTAKVNESRTSSQWQTLAPDVFTYAASSLLSSREPCSVLGMLHLPRRLLLNPMVCLAMLHVPSYLPLNPMVCSCTLHLPYLLVLNPTCLLQGSTAGSVCTSSFLVGSGSQAKGVQGRQPGPPPPPSRLSTPLSQGGPGWGLLGSLHALHCMELKPGKHMPSLCPYCILS